MTAKYAFIAATEEERPRYFGLKQMCRWLGVSASGFFDWVTRVPSAQARRREELKALVAWSFERSGRTYGYRRVHADLTRRGVTVVVNRKSGKVTTVAGASALGCRSS